MPVDVRTESVLDHDIATVADYATDPDNARAWYLNIQAVEWRTPPSPLDVVEHSTG
ncbi:MAG: hypothetical protein IT332_13670 [Ardenticatenales bacterium]|nr:hypothetical protein [Ardenticatenales bacterium]